MRTKKVVAPNYTEALKRVREELGEEALVLSTRSIKFDRENGGNQCSEMVEITAALEPETVDTDPVESEPQATKYFDEFDFGDGDGEKMNSLVNCLLAQTEKAQVMGLKIEQMDTFRKLVEAGVEDQLATLAFKRVNQNSRAEMIRGEMLESELARLMKKALKCPGPIQLTPWGPKVVALVGPTGAGKTTTLAKLAAYFALEKNKNVVLVSLDTYRIGAIEQLEIYGDLMRVPVELAGGRQDLEQILRKHIDKDLVLIDTMGRNPRDINYVGQLQEIFKAAPNMETHLVHSVTCRDDILSQTVKQFSPLEIDRLLFTKLDEGTSFGSLFNASVRYRIPFSYFTTGQRVPEDIEVAGEDQVIRLIFN